MENRKTSKDFPISTIEQAKQYHLGRTDLAGSIYKVAAVWPPTSWKKKNSSLIILCFVVSSLDIIIMADLTSKMRENLTWEACECMQGLGYKDSR